MDPVVIEDVASSFSKLRMYPYFDICHYILMTIAVKEDTPQSGSAAFSRRHPFSCWLATMLMCFGGAILSAFICGSPLFVCFDDAQSVFTATAVWYLINYFPFDLSYRLCKFLPIRLVICSMKEVQRAKKVLLGVHHGLHVYPDSAVMCVLLGLLKGCGSLLIAPASHLVMGVWEPRRNPILAMNFNLNNDASKFGVLKVRIDVAGVGGFTPDLIVNGDAVELMGHFTYLGMVIALDGLITSVRRWEDKVYSAVLSTTKISLIASVAYYLHHLELIPLSENQLFLATLSIFIYLRVTMILLGLKDPFSPFENIICTIVFGGTVDAIKGAFERSRIRSTGPPASAGIGSPTTPPFPTTGMAAPGSMGDARSPGAGVSGVSPGSAGMTANANGQTGLRDTGPYQPADKKRD